MRQTFIEILTELARKDKNVMLVTGDLGYSVFEKFAAEFPNQYLNCGIMEQAMMSIAAGLALSGKKPYVYSIIPFVTMRPFEQVRNDICYQNLDVKIVGIGAGFAYGALASTHYAIEDIAILRCLPNITVLSPADAKETRELVLQTYQQPGPAYIRMTKPERNLVPVNIKTILFQPSTIEEGDDGVIITTGETLQLGLEVIKKCKGQGKQLKLVSMHTLKPVDEKAFIEAIKNQKHVFTIEEHRVAGGLASIVAEIMMRHNTPAKLTTFGVDDSYPGITGHQEYLAAHHGIETGTIYQKIIKLLENGK